MHQATPLQKCAQRSQPLEVAPAALKMLFAGASGALYRRVLQAAHAAHLPFALGGGLAVAAYIGLEREHKDLDLYVMPDQRAQWIELMTQLGLDDYYEREPYDRAWIYRAHHTGTLVDVIWEMANHLAQVDEAWLTRGAALDVEGLRLCLLPPEELIWTKLHVLQKDRCDWPDVLNLLYATSAQLNWDHLLARLNEDVPLLTGALSVFGWLCPGAAAQVPAGVWRRLGLDPPAHRAKAPEVDVQRVKLIDSRPWFNPAP
jgi:hypothetical protein